MRSVNHCHAPIAPTRLLVHGASAPIQSDCRRISPSIPLSPPGPVPFPASAPVMSSPLLPASALLSPHAGLIQPTARGGSSQAHPPSSPLPHMFESAEPVRAHSSGSGSVVAAAAAPRPQPEAEACSSISIALPALPSSDDGSGSSSGRDRTSSSSSLSLSQSFSGMSVKPNAKKVLIFYCPEMSTLAAELVKLDDRFALAEVSWGAFADGWPNIFIQKAECVKKHECVFLANFHSPAVFFEQVRARARQALRLGSERDVGGCRRRMRTGQCCSPLTARAHRSLKRSLRRARLLFVPCCCCCCCCFPLLLPLLQFSVITALPKLLPKSFKLFLPFFPTGTMERVSRLGEVATANTLARILSTVPSCSKGPAQICIFDIHALQNQFYFKVRAHCNAAHGPCIEANDTAVSGERLISMSVALRSASLFPLCAYSCMCVAVCVCRTRC